MKERSGVDRRGEPRPGSFDRRACMRAIASIDLATVPVHSDPWTAVLDQCAEQFDAVAAEFRRAGTL